MSAELSLGQFGTFDVENYGDLLYPVLFEKMLQNRGITAQVPKFSLMGGESIQESGYRSMPIQQLFSSGEDASRSLIIGGGDLLLTDWDRMASHYRSIRQRGNESALRARWRAMVMRLLGLRNRGGKHFRQRHMNYAGMGPFIIDPDNFRSLESVAYFSCGVPFEFEENLKPRVASVMDMARFIYVRDRQSERKLRAAGITREIHVAPDLAVMLGEYFAAKEERAKGRRILERNGVSFKRRILCVQSNPQRRKRHLELFTQLKAYKADTGCEVVLLPLGRCHGDHAYLNQLARESGGAFRYIDAHSIFEMMAVIAACDVFLGKSLHGNVTAFAFGIPHVIGPLAAGKSDGFLDIVDLPPELKLNSWAEAGQRLDFVMSLGSEFFAAKARAARQRVGEVFDALLQAVAGAGKM